MSAVLGAVRAAAVAVVAGLIALLILAALFIAGGAGLGVSGAVVAAFLYFTGLVSLGTAKAIFLFAFAAGGVLGVLKGLVVVAAA